MLPSFHPPEFVTDTDVLSLDAVAAGVVAGVELLDELLPDDEDDDEPVDAGAAVPVASPPRYDTYHFPVSDRSLSLQPLVLLHPLDMRADVSFLLHRLHIQHDRPFESMRLIHVDASV